MITVPLKPKRSCLLLLASSLQDCVRGKNLSLFIAWLRVRAVDCPFQITALQILLPLIHAHRTPPLPSRTITININNINSINNINNNSYQIISAS